MTEIRDQIVSKLYGGRNPFMGPWVASFLDEGWNSHHPWLAEAIEERRPKVIVEIGVWQGASVANMARKIRDLRLDSVVIAVDTWLGSYEHWTDPKYSGQLSTLYQEFKGNIITEGLADIVVPLRLDSLNAARLLRHHSIVPDLIHLDAGHDYNSVFADLTEWWSLLEVGGMFIGDDYYMDGQWPAVKIATDQFLSISGVPSWQAVGGKWRATKSQLTPNLDPTKSEPS